MKPRSLAIPLLAAGLAGVGLVAWLARSSGAEGAAVEADPFEERSVPRSDELRAADEPEPVVVAPPPAPRELQREPAPPSEAVPDDALWLEGRVLFPFGTPADEEVRVVARGRRFEGQDDRKRHECELDAGGRFRVAFAERTRIGWIGIEARYLYLAGEVKVRPREQAGEVAIEPLLGGRVVGRADARVTHAVLTGWTEEEEHVQRSGTLAADGSFEFRAVPPLGDYDLLVEAPDRDRAELDDVAVLAGEVTTLEVVLERFVLLAGRVLGPDGRPVPGALVEGTSTARGGTIRSAKSSPDGAFRISNLPAGEVSLLARCDGLVPVPVELGALAPATWRASLGGVDPGATGLRLVLGPGVELRGAVLDDSGRPVDRFRVEALPVGTRLEPEIQEDMDFARPDGAFVFGGLTSGPWLVRAVPEDRRLAPSEAVRVELPSVAPVALVSARLVRIAGRVLGPDGEPIARAIVQGEPIEWDGSPMTVAHHGDQSDRSGAFELSRPPGRWNLRATARGYPPSEPVEVEVARGGEILDVVLRLERGARLTGELHPAVGEVAGRTVELQRVGGAFREELRTDDRGRFERDALAPGAYVVSLPPESSGDVSTDAELFLAFARTSRHEVALEGGGETHVVLGAPPARAIRVSGRVLDAGRPVASATVTWQAQGGPSAGARTDEAGEYEVALDRPGPWAVMVVGGGVDGVLVLAEVADAPSARCDLHLPTASIAGVVRGPDGGPLGGIPVNVDAGSLGADGELGFWPRDARTDAEGRYVLRHLPPLAYAVTVGGGDPFEDEDGSVVYALQRVDDVVLQEGEQRALDFHLRPGASISGTLLRASGAPVPNVRLAVRQRDGTLLPSRISSGTDLDGSFHVRGLPAGTFVLFAEGVEEREVRVAEGETVRVELVFAD